MKKKSEGTAGYDLLTQMQTQSKHKHKNKKNDMKVFAHYMGNEKDWNLSEDGLHEEGFRTRTVV